MALIQRGLGEQHTLLTKGLQQLYVVVDPDVPPQPELIKHIRGGGILKKAIKDGLIQTETITFRYKQRTITVEAVLINQQDLITVEAYLKNSRIQEAQIHVIRKEDLYG